MIGKRQAAVLSALREGPRTYSHTASKVGMLLPYKGYPRAEFGDLFGRCLANGWVHVAQWGDGAVRATEYELTDKGRAALRQWEAKQ